jgi:hypothetical protein
MPRNQTTPLEEALERIEAVVLDQDAPEFERRVALIGWHAMNAMLDYQGCATVTVEVDVPEGFPGADEMMLEGNPAEDDLDFWARHITELRDDALQQDLEYAGRFGL